MGAVCTCAWATWGQHRGAPGSLTKKIKEEGSRNGTRHPQAKNPRTVATTGRGLGQLSPNLPWPLHMSPCSDPGPLESVGEGSEWEQSTPVPMVSHAPLGSQGSQGSALTGSPTRDHKAPPQAPVSPLPPRGHGLHRPPIGPHVSQRSDHHLKMMFSRSNGYSMMPVVGTRTRSTSCWVGR